MDTPLQDLSAGQSAVDKLNDLWGEIVHTRDESGSFPSAIEMLGLFAEEMAPTFE